MPRAIVLTPVRHDGRRYFPGDTVELSTGGCHSSRCFRHHLRHHAGRRGARRCRGARSV